jgi:hypothetical protein
MKPDTFNARYFVGAGAVVVLLVARAVTGSVRRPVGIGLACALLLSSLAWGLYDEETNGSNPMNYQFREAVQVINQETHTGDRVLYAPESLGTVVGYYDRGPYRIAPLSYRPADNWAAGHIFVITSQSLMHGNQPALIGGALSQLGRRYHPIGHRQYDNVTVWEFA